EEQRQLFGDEYADSLTTMCEVAGVYSELGEHQKAKDIKVIVLEKWKQVFGDNDPHTLLAMSNLALTYSDLGEHQKAKDLQVIVLEKWKQVLKSSRNVHNTNSLHCTHTHSCN
ncbi:hypothetical protein C8R45DRAFT_833198, partial [Mycena sanguinolenta]